jgi:hypothetical protein
MKTLSGTSKLVILAAIGALSVLTFRAFAKPTPRPLPPEPAASKATFVLKIKNVTAVKDEQKFKDVLKNLKTQLYEIHMVHSQGQGPPENIPSPTPFAKLGIKTDKVTASETARNEAGKEYTLIQVHVTQRVASMYISDIQSVLNELQ